MAKENKEIGDIVKKCKILLLDIEGTTTSISFVKVGLNDWPAGVLLQHVFMNFQDITAKYYARSTIVR